MTGVETLHESGFEKVVFESVIDTIAGGVTLDVTGDDARFPDGVIPAGTLVSEKDPTTGVSTVVTITPASPDTYDKVPLGLTHATVKISNNTLVGVVIEGVVRKAAVSEALQNGAADLKTVLPKLTWV